jgi:hypothetical protein
MTLKKIKRFLSKKHKGVIMFFYYLKYFSLKQPKQKQIIVCFEGLFPHGGFVDRLKGIVSLYQVAKELEYDFKIVFDTPFQLSLFLEPNHLQWALQSKQITWHPTKTKLLYLINNFEANPFQIIKKSKAHQFYVYANIDYSKATFQELGLKNVESKWREDFNELFKKSELLKAKLNELLSEPYIAFHARFTSLMGDFEDTTSKVLSNEAQSELSQTLLDIINKEKAVENIKAYVFSDSIKFIEYVKTHSDINIVEGNPFHMDNFKKSDDLNNHLKTLIDFFMIANSDQICFLNVKPMYNSSFSKYAAIVGDTNFKVLNR